MQNSKNYLKTAIVYIRSFNKEQKNLISPEEQEKATTDFASKEGYRIVRVFRDVNVTGKSFNRPQLHALIQYIEANPGKVKFLIVIDITRLSTTASGKAKIRGFFWKNRIRVISILKVLLGNAGKLKRP